MSCHSKIQEGCVILFQFTARKMFLKIVKIMQMHLSRGPDMPISRLYGADPQLSRLNLSNNGVRLTSVVYAP